MIPDQIEVNEEENHQERGVKESDQEGEREAEGRVRKGRGNIEEDLHRGHIAAGVMIQGGDLPLQGVQDARIRMATTSRVENKNWNVKGNCKMLTGDERKCKNI